VVEAAKQRQIATISYKAESSDTMTVVYRDGSSRIAARQPYSNVAQYLLDQGVSAAILPPVGLEAQSSKRSSLLGLLLFLALLSVLFSWFGFFLSKGRRLRRS